MLNKWNKYTKGGLFWGLLMFVFMTYLFPLLEGSKITLKRTLIAIPIWVIAGMGMAYFNKRYNEKDK